MSEHSEEAGRDGDVRENPGQPLSVIGRLRVALMARLAQEGLEVIEQHPDHLLVSIKGRQHSIYLSNLARAIEMAGKAGLAGAGGNTEGSAVSISQEDLIAAVDTWLAANLRQIVSRGTFAETYRTLELARPVLLPRVVQPAGPTDPGQRWGRPLCDGFIELALVIDQPESVAFATPEMVAGWGAEQAEAVALENLRGRVQSADFRPLPDTGQLRMCASSDGYAAARILLAEGLIGSPFGLLAALPSRDLLFAEPLGRDSIQDLVYLALLANKSVGELPYPLSGEVFWIRGGQWRQIPIRIADGRMDVDSPEEFGEIVQRFMAEGNE